jgi:anti-anti-sigma regulatory factor
MIDFSSIERCSSAGIYSFAADNQPTENILSICFTRGIREEFRLTGMLLSFHVCQKSKDMPAESCHHSQAILFKILM